MRARGFIREVDGLRGIAILFVMLHHFWPQGGPLGRAAEVAHLGWIGVDLFYVISGFLIAGILLDTRDEAGYYRNYLARRVLRVFPLYYLFVASAFLLIPLAEGGWHHSQLVAQSGSPIWYLVYAGNLREAIVGHEPGYVLAPLWSLSIEEQFYLTFPFLVALLSRDRLRRVLWGLVVAAPLFRVVMTIAVPSNERIEYLATPARMDVLAVGCLLAIHYRTVRDGAATAPRWLGRALLALIAAMTVAYLLDGLDRNLTFGRTAGYSLVGATMLAFLWWTLEHRDGRATAFLRWRPLTQLGKICYGVYLLQRPAEVVLLQVLERAGIEADPRAIWLMLAKCAIAIAVATASWVCFEKPILRLKRRFASAAHPSHAATSLPEPEPTRIAA